MKNRVITISREFGSGGRTIGKKVAEELGIPCYDSELIEKVAEESGFHANYIKEGSMPRVDSYPPPFLTVPPGPTMRTTSGRSSIRSSPSWQRRAPASL